MQKRNLNLDVARIVAVLAVVMIHVSGKFIMGDDVAKYEFFCGNIFDCISRVGVPLFIMISGALMLDEKKDISFASIFSKNVFNIVKLLIFWSIFYCIIDQIIIPLRNGNAIDFPTFIANLSNPYYHMWYLYMIIGVYIATPFLRMFVKKDNKNLILFYIVISLMTHFTLPLLNVMVNIRQEFSHIVNFIDSFHADFFNGYIAYYLIGWYVVHVGIKQKNKVYILGIVSVVLTFFLVLITNDYQNAYSNINILVFLYSLALFTALNQVSYSRLSVKKQKIVTTLSNLCFGVYILHPSLILIIKEMIPYNGNTISYIIMFFGILIATSFVICLLISKTPYLKKIIRM